MDADVFVCGRICFSLGSMVVYLSRSHTDSISKMCEGGWSVVKSALLMFSVYRSKAIVVFCGYYTYVGSNLIED